MYVFNEVPSTDESKTLKTLAFPFQKGPSGFPAMAQPGNYHFVNIVATMKTGRGERVMNFDLGIDLYQFVFDNISPIRSAMISNAVANLIEEFIPGVRVQSVIPSQQKTDDAIGMAVVFDVVYVVNGESKQHQVIFSPTARGQ